MTPQESIDQAVQRTPNLNPEIVDEIAEILDLNFVVEKFPSAGGVHRKLSGRGGCTTSPNPATQTSQVPTRNTKNYKSLPYNPKLKERAKKLRKAGNLSEVLFWNQVRNKRFKSYDFDRQKIIGNYIVDFYCANCNVVIEIDGSSHDNKQAYDAARDAYLESQGLTVIHVPDRDVKREIEGVMRMLHDHPALAGTPPSEGNVGIFALIDLLDYIYAVLHAPNYREKYKECLKINLPFVPYVEDVDVFWKLVELGSQIRQKHLTENPLVEATFPQYPIRGDNLIARPKYIPIPKNKETNTLQGNVFINDTQYFANVPLPAWKFCIGGYQPAQNWLKDRKGRNLDFEDILHYQKMIVALMETNRLLKEIDSVIEARSTN